MQVTPQDSDLTRAEQRITRIDALRGVTLFGVCIVNAFYFHVPDAHFAEYYEQFRDPLNRAILFAVNHLFTAKFYPIFAFLFGLGFAIQFFRAQQKNANPYAILTRRFMLLALFGLAHILFVWEEDVLFLYAVYGLGLLTLTRRAPRTLLFAAVLAYSAPLAFLLMRGEPARAETLQLDGLVRFYSTASYWQIAQARTHIYLNQFTDPAFLLSEIQRIAFFLIGFLFGKQNLAQTFTAQLARWKKLWVSALGIWLISLTLQTVAFKADPGAASAVYVASQEVNKALGGLAQVFAYILGVWLWLDATKTTRIATWLAETGKLTLTHYLTQTALFSWLNYSYGLRLYATLAPVQVFALAAGVFLCQVAVSHFWLRAFNYGPVEWLWRALTYRRHIPFRRAAPG